MMNLFSDIKYYFRLGFVFIITAFIAFIVDWLFSSYVWYEDFYLKDAVLKSTIPGFIMMVIWAAQNRKTSRNQAQSNNAESK